MTSTKYINYDNFINSNNYYMFNIDHDNINGHGALWVDEMTGF